MLVVPVGLSSRWVTVRAPRPGWTVTWKVASRAPSGAKAAELVPTRSRALPRNARASGGGGGGAGRRAGGGGFGPETVTVRLAPWAPELGDTLLIVGTIGRSTVAEAEVPSAKLA